MYPYLPHTRADIDAMLKAVGAESLDDLYADVAPQLRLAQPYNLPQSADEASVERYFDRLADENLPLRACFAGAGFYQHHCPAAVRSIASRSEFLTAYTPYQPEISQGTLQYIFEYQTIMCRLTGMEVSNASMYDGATATAEAIMMAVAAQRRRNLVLVAETLSPYVRRVADTYARYHGVELLTIPQADGATDRTALEQMLAERGKEVAAVLVPQPNFFGIVEDHTGLAELCHSYKALLIINCIASDLAVLRTPGEYGADIACGDAQSLGIPLNFGGPYLGFLCSTKALMRKMPGRIVGQTTDSEGRRCFVLTLQAREQHIRREKATSNICSNQGLMTLWVAAWTSLVGAEGLREINERSLAMALYLLEKLTASGKARLKFPSQPFLNEFALTTDYDVDDLISACMARGILPGVKIDSHTILIAATETVTREDADLLCDIANNL